MRHMTFVDRIKLETLYNKEKRSNKYIADYLGFTERTIRNELKRGLYIRRNSNLTESICYSPDIAQKDYDYKATNKGVQLKVENDYKFVQFCEACILKLHWSPDSIIGFIKKHNIEFRCKVCAKTLYNYIDMGLFLNVSNKDLLIKSRRKKNTYNEVKPRTKKPLVRSIEERSNTINYRTEFGHWEMDTVIGKREKNPCLLVFTERLTRYEIIMKIKSKTQTEVNKALNRLERTVKGFKDIFKTITIDNGSEFLNDTLIEKSCKNKGNRTVTYYCHSYSSWERGSNENANKLIRRFIPKGEPIENYSNAYIEKIQNWINRLPRKIHNYCSANDLLHLYNMSIC